MKKIHTLDKRLEMRMFQRPPDLIVCEGVERVQVGPEWSGEQNGVLRDDGDAGTQRVQTQGGDVNPINEDLAAECLHNSVKRDVKQYVDLWK